MSAWHVADAPLSGHAEKPVFLSNRLSFCEEWFVKWLEEGGEREEEVKHILSVLSSISMPVFCRRCTETPWIKWVTF